MWHIDGILANNVPVDDRALAYGDGVFETIAVVDGKAALWPAHRARLCRGCRSLGFAPPSARALDGAVDALTGGGHGVIKLTVSRGSGGRGYFPPPAPRPRLISCRMAVPQRPPSWWWRGVRLRYCTTTLGNQPALAGLKHLNRLEQVLARSEWSDPEIAEGLMSDHRQRVVEGTSSNIFARFGRELRTPPLVHQGVAGIMRRQVLSMARELDLRARVMPLTHRELEAADEVWLTNSLIGLWPVRLLENRHWEHFQYGHALLRCMLTRRWIIPPDGASG